MAHLEPGNPEFSMIWVEKPESGNWHGCQKAPIKNYPNESFTVDFHQG